MKQLPVTAPTKEELVEQLSTVQESYGNYLSTLPKEKVTRIHNSIAGMRHGLQSVAPVICMGPQRCIFIEHCPIPDRTFTGDFVRDSNRNPIYGPDEDYPIARPCVMESMYMQQKIIDYVKHLDVDPANPVEMSIVNELALIDLLKNRALIMLSRGDKSGQGQDLLRVDVTNFNKETGEEAYHTTLHPAADYIDKLEKRREKWLDKLVETRKGKIDTAHKLGQKESNSKVLDEINKLRKAITEATTSQIEEAEVLEITIDS